MAAHGTLGSWAKATHARRALRGKARLLPRAASTVRSAILRRRDTASLSRLRPLAHHANRSLAVPLRLLLPRVALTRPSIRRVFLRSPCARRRSVDSLTFARGRKRTLPLTGNVAILAAHPEQPSTYPPKTSQLSLPKVSFLRRKNFYDLRLDLRFVW